MFQWLSAACSLNLRYFILVFPILAVCQGSALAITETAPPTWTVPVRIASDDGYAWLDWEVSEGEPVSFFKLTEVFDEQSKVHYVEKTGLKARRLTPGKYQFTVQSCVKSTFGLPDCGGPSITLTVKVSNAVTASLLTEGQIEPGVVTSSQSLDGGPDQLRPGDWGNPAKDGQGWNFFWANRLALPENDPSFGNSYDLVGTWYTFEAKLAYNEPDCSTCPPIIGAYRPVVLVLKAVLTSPGTYSGSLYVSQNDGGEIWVGGADVIFGSSNRSATINWSANFKKENLSDSDPLTSIQGSDPADYNNISHFSGLWKRSGNDSYFVVSDIGSAAELVNVVFHDDAGDPVWTQAVNFNSPVSGSTDFCLGYLGDGYSPAIDKPSGWTQNWHLSGCDSSVAASSTNRNGRRYFTVLHKQFFWANFSLPGTIYASGSISIGSSSSPVGLNKAANFHAVSYDNSSGASCELTNSAPVCSVVLTWFTDGNYPSATVFAHNQTTGVYTKVLTSTQPVMRDIAFNLTSAGVYEFEMRMGDGTQTTLLADSNNFTVTEGISNSPPVLTTPENQVNFEGRKATLYLSATDPDTADVLTFSATGLPSGLIIYSSGYITGRISADVGDYRVTAVVVDDHGNSDSKSFTWTVKPSEIIDPGGNPETPPTPAVSPGMTANSSSSRVGATAGEFRVDESGSATYSIPILAAPASGGLQPQISLNYSSQAGNGNLGVGWTLGGVSAISRCAQTMEQDGISGSKGISLDNEDRFCLDGQRLILDPSSGAYGANGSRYRTEIDNFSRITSYGSAGDGPAWFKVETRGGAVIQYGKSSDSRIEARGGANPATVITWAQNRFEDRFRNYILFSYEENSNGPVAFAIKAINYSGNARAGTLPSARLTFTYSDRPLDSDVAYFYNSGIKLEQRKLLQSIRSQGRLNAGSQLEDLRYYDLTYGEDGVGRKILTSVTECRSASLSTCYKPTRLTWLKSENQVDNTGSALSNLLPKSSLAGLLMADVNGDGRPDLLYTELKKRQYYLKVKTATANATFSEWSNSYELPKTSEKRAPQVLAIDINADGLQDIVYGKYVKTSDDYRWVARVSTGSGFSAETQLNPSYRYYLNDQNLESRVQVMDFNGDGLGDILHTHTDPLGDAWQMTVLLNESSADGNLRLSDPIDLNVDNSDLFNRILVDGWEMGNSPPNYLWSTGIVRDYDIPDARVFDFNGDGSVDLLLKVWRQYQLCIENCVQLASGSGGGKGNKTSDPVYNYKYASYWVLMESKGQNNFSRHSVVARGKDCTVSGLCKESAYDGLPYTDNMWPVDINADGLADLAWSDQGNNWRFKLNTGAGFEASEQIGSVPSGVGKLARFEDWNGDTYPDLIYPSGKRDNNATWMVYQNYFGRLFAAASNTLTPAGNVGGDADFEQVENDGSVFADFDGDGKLDLLLIDYDKSAEIISTRMYEGMNVSGSRTAEPANVITTITNGLGAANIISYKPLTDSSVYTRMHDSAAANWGHGAVVYDMTVPTYVASEVSISAPVYNAPSATSRLQYHYVGAKIQAGGRGFLGFAEVISYDFQSKIRTNTRYRQDFPFIGLPADIMQAANASASKFNRLSNVSATTPHVWGNVSASTLAPSSPGGTLVSYSINEWISKSTVAGAVFPYIVDSLERSYTLSGIFDRKLLTSSSYDADGNLVSSKLRTYATNETTAFTTLSTVNVYWSTDYTNWYLGRLKTSTVTHNRAGTSSITRKSAFEYDNATGALNKETTAPLISNLEVVTTYALDNFGNRISTSVTGKSMSTRTNRASYDSLGRWVIQTKNALGQVAQRVTSWDVFGNPLVATNIDGVKTTSAADSMGWPFIRYTETGVWTKTLNYTGTGSYCPAGTVFRTTTTGSGAPTQIKCFDKLGRENRTAIRGFNGSYAYTDQYYDASNRVARISEPYLAGATRYWNQTAYDDLGRVTAVLSAAGDDTTRDYDNQADNTCIASGTGVMLTTNGLGQDRVEIKNVLDETTAVYDNNCGLVSYEYDAVGNLKKITGADGEVVTMTYDLAGRKVSLNDPDKGLWRYAYNALGEMSRQLDSKDQAVDFSYDSLGRITNRRERKNVSSLTDSVFTTVNRESTTYITSGAGKGQVNAVIYRSGESGAVMHQKSISYDSFGRVDTVRTTIDGNVYAEQTTYDQYSRVFQQFDATGGDRGLRYVYSNGYLSKLKEARDGTSGIVYQDIQAMDARGNVTAMQLGNGVDVDANYEPNSGRLLKLSAFDAMGGELQDVDYLFDVLGNLKQRHDKSGGSNLRETFSYDALSRLKSVGLSVNGATSTQTLSLNYDSSGNIAYKSDVGTYLYNGSQPHAVSRAGNISYGYDANGNQTTGDGRAITYTVFDKPNSITKGTNRVEFAYGIGNSRYQRKDYEGGVLQQSTLYLGSTERITENGSTFYKRYLGGVAIASYYPSTTVQQLSYLLKDHIGSNHSVLNDAGLITATMHFSAFGQRQGSNWKTPLTSFLYAPLNDITTRGFTGHEQVDSVGIVHMNGRIYDPRLGRFLQADPVVQAPRNSQSLNRYSYVLNNPLSYTDPSGYFSLKSFFRLAVAAVASYFTFGAAYAWMATSLANAAAAGTFLKGLAVIKAVAAVAAGSAAGFVGGAIATGSVKGAVQGALIGAIVGGIGAGANPYGRNVGDAIARSGLGIAAQENKLFSAVNYLYVGASGSLKAIASSLSTPRNIAKTALNYGVAKKVGKLADKLGLEWWEFNLALTVNSFIGLKVAGNALTEYTDGSIRIDGFFNRDKLRWFGAFWDVNDTILGYQGLPDAIGYQFIAKFSGRSIFVSHSLGALRASNLVALGFASSANIYSLPFGNISPSGSNVVLGRFDFVNGFFFGGILNPSANLTPCINSGPSGSFCHKFIPNYGN